MKLPRVLLLSEEIPQSMNAGSILMRRLFLEYPPDRLLALGPAPQRGAELLSCRYEVVHPWARRLETTRFARLPRTLDALGLHRLSNRSVTKAVANFRPDAVVSVMQGSSFYGAGARFARRNNLPFVVIVHDVIEEFEQVYFFARSVQRKRNARVYRQAVRRLCVSPQMAEFLRRRYGVTGEVLYPNRSEDLLPRAPELNLQLRTDTKLVVGYAGSLAYGYGPQLGAMLPAFEKAGATLNLYSKSNLTSGSKALSYLGFFPAEELWRRVQSECDVVLLVYRFGDSADALLYRTHFPSKLTEYVALGMPILIIGPEFATGVQWALQHEDAAFVLTNNSQEQLVEMLRALASRPDLRAARAASALAISKAEFHPKTIRSQFLHVLSTLTEQNL